MKKVLLALALALLLTGSASAQYGTHGHNGFNRNFSGYRTFNTFGNYGYVNNAVVFSPFVVSPYAIASPVIVSTPSVYSVAPFAYAAPAVYSAAPLAYAASAPVTYSVTLATAQTYGYATPFNVVFNAGNFYHAGTGAVIRGNFANYLHSVHASRR